MSAANKRAARPVLAYVVHTLNPGGTEKLVVEMSIAFAQDFEVHVLCLDEPGGWAAQVREAGISVHCLWRQPGFDVSVAWKIAVYCRRRRVDLIHAHQCTPWMYAALSRLRYARPRLLFEEHGRFYPEVENKRRAWFNRLVVKNLTHKTVAVSEDIRQRLQRYEGLPARDIEVIYNGVDPEPSLSAEQRAQLRAELDLSVEDFVVGTVGRFDSIKNLPMLVKALAAASRQCERLRGVLVGHGPLFEEIRSLVEAQGLAHRVRLTGFRQDARKVTQCMDLFVLASFSEGTSMALLDAMAAAVPVAVTAVGGNPEIVQHNTTGWVIPSDATNALTTVILEAATHSDRRRAFALAGRRRYAEMFNKGRMLDAYRQRYRQLLSDLPLRGAVASKAG